MEQLKRYQVVTDGGIDGGLDEKTAHLNQEEAEKACKQYVAEGYEGAAIYDFATRTWLKFYGNFHLE